MTKANLPSSRAVLRTRKRYSLQTSAHPSFHCSLDLTSPLQSKTSSSTLAIPLFSHPSPTHTFSRLMSQRDTGTPLFTSNQPQAPVDLGYPAYHDPNAFYPPQYHDYYNAYAANSHAPSVVMQQPALAAYYQQHVASQPRAHNNLNAGMPAPQFNPAFMPVQQDQPNNQMQVQHDSTLFNQMKDPNLMLYADTDPRQHAQFQIQSHHQAHHSLQQAQVHQHSSGTDHDLHGNSNDNAHQHTNPLTQQQQHLPQQHLQQPTQPQPATNPLLHLLAQTQPNHPSLAQITQQQQPQQQQQQQQPQPQQQPQQPLVQAVSPQPPFLQSYAHTHGPRPLVQSVPTLQQRNQSARAPQKTQKPISPAPPDSDHDDNDDDDDDDDDDDHQQAVVVTPATPAKKRTQTKKTDNKKGTKPRIAVPHTFYQNNPCANGTLEYLAHERAQFALFCLSSLTPKYFNAIYTIPHPYRSYLFPKHHKLFCILCMDSFTEDDPAVREHHQNHLTYFDLFQFSLSSPTTSISAAPLSSSLQSVQPTHCHVCAQANCKHAIDTDALQLTHLTQYFLGLLPCSMSIDRPDQLLPRTHWVKHLHELSIGTLNPAHKKTFFLPDLDHGIVNTLTTRTPLPASYSALAPELNEDDLDNFYLQLETTSNNVVKRDLLPSFQVYYIPRAAGIKLNAKQATDKTKRRPTKVTASTDDFPPIDPQSKRKAIATRRKSKRSDDSDVPSAPTTVTRRSTRTSMRPTKYFDSSSEEEQDDALDTDFLPDVEDEEEEQKQQQDELRPTPTQSIPHTQPPQSSPQSSHPAQPAPLLQLQSAAQFQLPQHKPAATNGMNLLPPTTTSRPPGSTLLTATAPNASPQIGALNPVRTTLPTQSTPPTSLPAMNNSKSTTLRAQEQQARLDAHEADETALPRRSAR